MMRGYPRLRALLCFISFFSPLSSRSLFLRDFLLYRVLIRLKKGRKRPDGITGAMEIGNGKKERYNTSTGASPGLSPFSILFALFAVFLDREIVVRRFIYSRSAKFTGCVAGAVLINHAVRFKRFWREERQRVSSLFHRSTTGLYLLHVSAVFAKRCAPENGAEECNTSRIIAA